MGSLCARGDDTFLKAHAHTLALSGRCLEKSIKYCGGGLAGCGCGKPIVGSYVVGLGVQWHKECFVCAGCKGSLEQGYIVEDNKAYCKEECLPDYNSSDYYSGSESGSGEYSDDN